MSMPYVDKYGNNVFSALKMYTRTNPTPLDPSSVFNTYADLEAYVAGPTSYAGQLVAVANGTIEASNGNKDYTFYVIRSDKSLQVIGSNLVFATRPLAETWVATNTDSVIPGTVLTVLNGTAYDLYTINPDKTLKKASFDATTDLPEVNWSDIVGIPVSTPDEIDEAVDFTQSFTTNGDGRLTYTDESSNEEVVAFKSDLKWGNIEEKPKLVNTVKVSSTAAEVNVSDVAAQGDVVFGDAASKVVAESIPNDPTAEEKSALPTMEAVKAYADALLGANDAMVFKGVIAGGSTGAYGALTPAAEKGHTYKVSAAGAINGVNVEIGDVLICLEDGTVEATADNYTTVQDNWVVIQANIDGAVVGPASSVSDRIAVFDGTTGKVIKDSGFTIKTSVPENAVFTDTTYEVFDTTQNGLVPKPTAADAGKFLRGDGTWVQETTYSDFAGSDHGLVPASTSEEGKFLAADGTWATPQDTTYNDFAGGEHGLVPDATGQTGKFLASDGTWATPQDTTYAVMTGATASTPGTSGLVPAPKAGEQNMFLRGDGKYAAETTYEEFAGSDAGLVPASTGADGMYLDADGNWTKPQDTTYNDFAGSDHGLVPASTSEAGKFLASDGTWAKPQDTFMATKAAEEGKVAVGVTSGTELEYADVAGLKMAGYTKNDTATGAVAATDTIADAFSKVENTMDAHVHGNITRDGKLTGISLKVVTTAADGTIIGSDVSIGGAALPENPTEKVLATEKAVKEYCDALLGANDAMTLKGAIAGGSTGAYGALTPAAEVGHAYKVSAAGMVNGIKVEPGDMLICTVDTAEATVDNYETIAANWIIIQTNTDVFVGATATNAGTTGLVPAPKAGDENKVLKANGTWSAVGTDLIVDKAVTNDKLANMTAKTIKGNASDVAAAATDLTAEQVREIINVEDGANNYTHPTQAANAAAFVKVGNDGAGHVVIGDAITKDDVVALGIPAQDTTYSDFAGSDHGLVPASTSEEGKFLASDGTWKAPVTMVGATSSADGAAGFVPAPKAGEENMPLLGNGKYQKLIHVGTTDPGDTLAIGGIWFKEIARDENDNIVALLGGSVLS